MIPQADAPIANLCDTLSYVRAALTTASTVVDPDRTDADRTFFGEQAAAVDVHLQALEGSETALRTFRRRTALIRQASVVLGDAILDRGVESGAAKTKAALRGKPGLGAEHVFGSRVSDLTRSELRVEPGLVLTAAAHLLDLPDFEGRDKIKADLELRANQQHKLLAERDAGYGEEAKIQGAATKLAVDAVLALHSVQGLLLARFPKQRQYTSAFFPQGDRSHKAASPVPVVDPAPPPVK